MQKIIIFIVAILSSGFVFNMGYALVGDQTTMTYKGVNLTYIEQANGTIKGTGIGTNGSLVTVIQDKNGNVQSMDVAAPLQSDSIREAANAQSPSTSPSTATGPMTIYTSEMVPGAKCQCVTGGGTTESLGTMNVTCTGAVTARKYKCTVPTGLAGFQTVFAQIIRFVINIVLLLGVLAVVGLGIAWSFAGGDDIKAKSSLKKWAINILIGLVILFMFRYILLFLAPWVYQ